jgi:TonB family protein
MTETWKQLEGQVVDGRFTLGEYLGGTEYSADFAVQAGTATADRGVLKIVITEPDKAEAQLQLWNRAAQLTHPNLLRVLHAGRCQVTQTESLYVVMERAEEDLSQILKERALTPEEAHEMLTPVLEALAYLHGKGFAHGHLKPSNVLATGDQIKLTSDDIVLLGTARMSGRQLDVYDAPETASAPVTIASDAWSLGVTLVEALTQQPPAVNPKQDAEPVLASTLAQPFLDIARHTVLFDPGRRWTTVDIASYLKSGRSREATAGVAASVSEAPPAVAPSVAPLKGVPPLSVPLSPERAIPATKLQKLSPRTTRAQDRQGRRQPGPQTPQPMVLPNYVIPALAGVFLLVAIYALPKILRHRTEPLPSAANVAESSAASSKPDVKSSRREPPAATSSAKGSTKSVVDKKAPTEAPDQVASAAAPATLRSKTYTGSNDTPDGSVTHGEVLDQVLPEISGKARDTIQGTVRVEVAVKVDAAGNVTEAEVLTPGPSRYFADLTMKAARRWQFSSPEVNGRSVPSEWLIRFEYTQTNTQAVPTQTAP